MEGNNENFGGINSSSSSSSNNNNNRTPHFNLGAVISSPDNEDDLKLSHASGDDNDHDHTQFQQAESESESELESELESTLEYPDVKSVRDQLQQVLEAGGISTEEVVSKDQILSTTTGTTSNTSTQKAVMEMSFNGKGNVSLGKGGNFSTSAIVSAASDGNGLTVSLTRSKCTSTSIHLNANIDLEDVVKEFTVTGNRLTPTQSPSATSITRKSTSTPSSIQKEDDGDEEENDNGQSSTFNIKGNSHRNRKKEEHLSKRKEGHCTKPHIHCNKDVDSNEDIPSLTSHNGDTDSDGDYSDNDDDFDSRDDDDIDNSDDLNETKKDQVIGDCLHCHILPPHTEILKSNKNSKPCSSNRITSGRNTTQPNNDKPAAPGIQVSCDDCHRWICSECHWCHEYQANHEIRVCDRCDQFSCKTCDEMDQCEDCGEVVCSSCATLCSCKFCGCGLCEECATTCGRCGIVLCERDSKFAVDCDTCKMSYCLVCLASGTKDPCVRCGHRTSKRVEQLVHLRLKSIYKAFKQSGATINNNASKNTKGSHSTHSNAKENKIKGNQSTTPVSDTQTENFLRPPYNLMDGSGNDDNKIHSIGMNNNNKRGRNSIRGGRGRPGEYSPPPLNSSPSHRNISNWMNNKKSSPISMPLPANVAKYAQLHGKDFNKRTNIAGNTTKTSTSRRFSTSSKNNEHVPVLMTASTSFEGVEDCGSSHTHSQPYLSSESHLHGLHLEEPTCSHKHTNPQTGGSNSNYCQSSVSQDIKSSHIGFSGSGNSSNNVSDKFASRTQAEADAAAAALLAELEEEKILTEANSKAKKNKKKKKKLKQQAAAAAKELKEGEIGTNNETKSRDMHSVNENTLLSSNLDTSSQIKKELTSETFNFVEPSSNEKVDKISNDALPTLSLSLTTNQQASYDNDAKETIQTKVNPVSKCEETSSASGTAIDDNDDVKESFLKENMEVNKSSNTVRNSHKQNIRAIIEEEVMDEIVGNNIKHGKESVDLERNCDDKSLFVMEKKLLNLVKVCDLNGIEKLVIDLKGVPGRAALRKNAKKAIKRIKEENAASKITQESNILLKKQDNATNDRLVSVENQIPKQERAEIRDSILDSAQFHTEKNKTKIIAKVESQISTGAMPQLSKVANSNNNLDYKAPEPLLRLISLYRVPNPTNSGTSRSECVMHMAPSVVGWVIGKGGQRIRDLMEESGAKVWIDQDSMGPKEMRIVYVSGSRKSVDAAVRMVKELVAKAPVGYAAPPSTVPHSVNDSGSVTSGRSSLTSTPLSFAQGQLTQQSPAIMDRPRPGSVGRSISNLNHGTSSSDNVLPSFSKIAQYGSVAYSAIAPSVSNSQVQGDGVDSYPPSTSMHPNGLSELSTNATHGNTATNNYLLLSNPPRNNATIVKEIMCEPRFVPLLIGRRGWTVKQIQDTSGARVDIDQTVNPRRVLISGEHTQVDLAVQLVHDVLCYPHADLHHQHVDEEPESAAFNSGSQHVNVTSPYENLQQSGNLLNRIYNERNANFASNLSQQEVTSENKMSNYFDVNSNEYGLSEKARMQSEHLNLMQQQYPRYVEPLQAAPLYQQQPSIFPTNRSILDSNTNNTSFKQQDSSLMQPSPSTGSSALGNQRNQNKIFHNQQDIQSDIFSGRNSQYLGPAKSPPGAAMNEHSGAGMHNTEQIDFISNSQQDQTSQYETAQTHRLHGILPIHRRVDHANMATTNNFPNAMRYSQQQESNLRLSDNRALSMIQPHSTKNVSNQEITSLYSDIDSVLDEVAMVRQNADRDVIADMFGANTSYSINTIAHPEKDKGSFFNETNSRPITKNEVIESRDLGLWGSELFPGVNNSSPNLLLSKGKRTPSDHSIGLGGLRLDG